MRNYLKKKLKVFGVLLLALGVFSVPAVAEPPNEVRVKLVPGHSFESARQELATAGWKVTSFVQSDGTFRVTHQNFPNFYSEFTGTLANYKQDFIATENNVALQFAGMSHTDFDAIIWGYQLTEYTPFSTDGYSNAWLEDNFCLSSANKNAGTPSANNPFLIHIDAFTSQYFNPAIMGGLVESDPSVLGLDHYNWLSSTQTISNIFSHGGYVIANGALQVSGLQVVPINLHTNGDVIEATARAANTATSRGTGSNNVITSSAAPTNIADSVFISNLGNAIGISGNILVTPVNNAQTTSDYPIGNWAWFDELTGKWMHSTSEPPLIPSQQITQAWLDELNESKAVPVDNNNTLTVGWWNPDTQQAGSVCSRVGDPIDTDVLVDMGQHPARSSSLATPVVGALVQGIRAKYPHMTVAQAHTSIVNSTRLNSQAPVKDRCKGWGVVKACKAFEYAERNYPIQQGGWEWGDEFQLWSPISGLASILLENCLSVQNGKLSASGSGSYFCDISTSNIPQYSSFVYYKHRDTPSSPVDAYSAYPDGIPKLPTAAP